MAGRIKGITVEINGDTTGLTKALSGVNKEIKNTQSQLKDVEKLLKLDPGNTELLAQKHRLLGDAVAETKEKLKTLKQAAEQANDALANGDISKEQYDALQREIIETEQALERLESQANESATAVQKIAAAGSNMQELGGKIEGVGKSLMPLSAAVTGIGVAGLKVATDFEKAMSGVQAITGATGDEFEKLREVAIDLGATTAFSSGEVAEAMTEMAKAGWNTTQIIDGMLTSSREAQFLNVASPMLVTSPQIIMFSRLVQFSNTESFMTATELGMLNSFSPVHKRHRRDHRWHPQWHHPHVPPYRLPAYSKRLPFRWFCHRVRWFHFGQEHTNQAVPACFFHNRHKYRRFRSGQMPTLFPASQQWWYSLSLYTCHLLQYLYFRKFQEQIEHSIE